MKSYLTKTPSETKKIGKETALLVLKQKPQQKAMIIALKGELGSGKTTFSQGFAKGLKIKEKVLSPTFVIFKKFLIRKNKRGFKNFYHLDCYRIKNPKEILELGFKEIISNPKNIVLIEWPEKIKKILPKETHYVYFKTINDQKRNIKIKFKSKRKTK